MKRGLIFCWYNFIAIDWARFDLALVIDNIGFNMFFGLLLAMMIMLYVCMIIFSLIYFIRVRKMRRLISIIPFILMLLVFTYYWVVNFSDVYVDIDYAINRNSRQEIIKMYENNQLKQISANKYLLPYRLAWHNKKVYIKTKEGVTEAIFFISNGLNYNRILLYVSDDRIACNSDFGEDLYWSLQNIKKLSYNWCYAEIFN